MAYIYIYIYIIVNLCFSLANLTVDLFSKKKKEKNEAKPNTL